MPPDTRGTGRCPSRAGDERGTRTLPPRRRGRSLRSRSARTSVPVLVVVAVAAVAVVAAAFVAFLLLDTSPPPVRDLTVGPTTVLSPEEVNALENASIPQRTIYASNGTVWVVGTSAHLVVRLSPPSHDDRFSLAGLENPTVHLRKNLRLTLTVVNMDTTDLHNWALTTAAPPYATMPGMAGSMGRHLWGSAMLGEASPGHVWAQELTLTLPVDGQLWYVCQQYGHAHEGMFGSFVVFG